MNIPNHVQTLIDQEVAAILQHPDHALLPFRRLMLYDAFGPTFGSTTYEERVQILQNGQLPLTIADRVRARLAILTAYHVLPLWYPSLEASGLLDPIRIEPEIRALLSEMVRLYVVTGAQQNLIAQLGKSSIDYSLLKKQISSLEPHEIDSTKRAIMQECADAGIVVSSSPITAIVRISLDPRLAEHRSVYLLPITELPIHNLQLAEGVLKGTVNPRNGLSQSSDIRECFGNFLGYEEEELPARAYDVGMATYEALNQALGLGPFDRQEITPTTTDAFLIGEGAAAAAGLKAYSGVFEDNISTSLYNPEKQLEFWLWWLTKAIPAAWADETEATSPPTMLATMPFRKTVRVTQYATGIKFTFDKDALD
jgi:hypothetical protein